MEIQKKEGVRGKRGKREGRGLTNWCVILKTGLVLFCMHRGTVCMHGSGFLLSPYSRFYTKFANPFSQLSLTVKLVTNMTSVVVKKYIVRTRCFSDQTCTLQLAHSHEAKQINVLTNEWPSYYFLRYFLPHCKNIWKPSSDQYEGSTSYKSESLLKKVSMHKQKPKISDRGSLGASLFTPTAV